jgi:phage baseplate assembly protein W
MSGREPLAWRFWLPDFDAGQHAPGLQLSAVGKIETVSGEESIRQSILLLLATAPGERVMHPDYGCNLHRLMFAPNDESTAGLAMHYVRQSIERFEPRVEILALDANRSEEQPELLEISLAYQVRATQQTGQVTFSLNLMEGEV